MLSLNETLLRLSLASLFGALIGFERERINLAAGLRTHMLVCVGSCLIMIVSAFGFSDILGTEHVSLDPSRIAAQVVSGIGFIGAGSIFFLKEGGTVRGLTTATGIWVVAAIGLATGGGLYQAAGFTTFIALIILWVLHPLEQFYSKKFRQRTLKIVLNSNIDISELLKNLLDTENFRVQSFLIEKNNDNFIFKLKLRDIDIKRIETIINKLKDNSDIKEISWSK